MASGIFIGDKSLFVSNSRFRALIDFAIEVAPNVALKGQEKEYITKLVDLSMSYYPGFDLDLERELPEMKEKVFWSKVFQAVGYKVFLREIGNIEELNWQPSLICDAITISRMLQEYTGEKLPYTEKYF